MSATDVEIKDCLDYIEAAFGPLPDRHLFWAREHCFLRADRSWMLEELRIMRLLEELWAAIKRDPVLLSAPDQEKRKAAAAIRADPSQSALKAEVARLRAFQQKPGATHKA
jgi:hypothetical protein